MVKFNLDLNGKTILVTGAAGFIGSNLAKRLINDYKDIKVIGLDTMTDYSSWNRGSWWQLVIRGGIYCKQRGYR